MGLCWFCKCMFILPLLFLVLSIFCIVFFPLYCRTLISQLSILQNSIVSTISPTLPSFIISYHFIPEHLFYFRSFHCQNKISLHECLDNNGLTVFYLIFKKMVCTKPLSILSWCILNPISMCLQCYHWCLLLAVWCFLVVFCQTTYFYFDWRTFFTFSMNQNLQPLC